MSVYVDNYRADYCGMKMSHMMADTEDELDAMAVALSLSPSWKQIIPGRPPHYDVSESKRLQAIRLGAIPVTPRELVTRMTATQESPDVPRRPDASPTRKQFRVIQAAFRLNDWLRANVGDTDDWPVHLHVDNDADADTLAKLLTELSHASNALRAGTFARILADTDGDTDSGPAAAGEPRPIPLPPVPERFGRVLFEGRITGRWYLRWPQLLYGEPDISNTLVFQATDPAERLFIGALMAELWYFEVERLTDAGADPGPIAAAITAAERWRTYAGLRR